MSIPSHSAASSRRELDHPTPVSMKLFYCFTPAHKILLERYFLPTVPRSFVLVPAKLEIAGAGDFLSPEFLRCICQKVDLILDSIREHPGEIIVWSDIDIQFFNASPDRLTAELESHDIVFQREGQRVADVNTGFFACRCGPRTYDFFTQVKEGLLQNPKINEQYLINDLLRAGTDSLSWGYLPLDYYARTHGWPPPKDLAIYHANGTPGKNGVQQKIQQFRELAFLRRFRMGALIVTSLKYAPKRILRMVSERLGLRKTSA